MHGRAHHWSPALHGFARDVAQNHIFSLFKGELPSCCFLLIVEYERAFIRRPLHNNHSGCPFKVPPLQSDPQAVQTEASSGAGVPKRLVPPSSTCSSEETLL